MVLSRMGPQRILFVGVIQRARAEEHESRCRLSYRLSRRIATSAEVVLP
jgi:hypothetical protein